MLWTLFTVTVTLLGEDLERFQEIGMEGANVGEFFPVQKRVIR